MFSSEQIWTAIDRLALRNGLSVSRLAIYAGLDATALNKSKRITGDGASRWISTETMAKLLTATGTSPQDFFEMIAAAPSVAASPRRVGATAHILLVDPDRSSLDRMATELDAAGYEVDRVPDLRHALGVIENSPSLDMLVTNLDLPYGAHGRTLAHIALTYRPSLAILYLAGRALPRLAGIESDLVLRLPLEEGRLSATVARLLAGRRGSAAARRLDSDEGREAEKHAGSG